MSKPPFIATQGLRLLADRQRPERFLRPEYFRAGRALGAGRSGQDVGNWFPVDRQAVARNRVTDHEGGLIDLSRLVITTDAGVGKTTEMRWLEAELSQPGASTAAFFLTFGQLPQLADQLIDEVLAPQLVQSTSAVDASSKQEAIDALHLLRQEGRLVLLLDALDQAPADGSAARVLAELLRDPRWQTCRIVVSGRPHALQRHWSSLFATHIGHAWRFLQVDEFDETQQRVFLGRDESGRKRIELIPEEAREILSTPRVLEFLRELAPDELKQIQTAGDVYWRSVEHLLAHGMRNSEPARRIGLAAQERTPSSVQARSMRRARQLLGAMAFEMTSAIVQRRDPESGQEQGVPNFDGVRRGQFRRYRERLLERLSSPLEPADTQQLDHDLDGLAALNDFVSQGFFDAVAGLQEIFWRNRTLQEFFTAFWLSQYGTTKDGEALWDWVYLPDRPLTEEYYWVWRFLAEMHNDAVDPESWASAIEPIFRAGDGTADGTKRSTEMMYRAWQPLQALADAGEAPARAVLNQFLGEFEQQILLGKRGEEARQTAQQLCDSLVEIPAGEFQMGAPVEKQGIPEDDKSWWREFLEADGDPASRAESLVDDWYSFPPGKAGQKLRQEEIAWWVDVIENRDLAGVIARSYPLDESPENPIRQIDAFLLARWPTLNACFRLFRPEHGVAESYYSEVYVEISPEADTPAIFVSWYDAWAFCQWLSWEGQSCRLPHEDQWEYAAKAGTAWDQNYWWGDDFDSDKCNAENNLGRTAPPDDARQNGWGLIDMLGNVEKWTADEYRESYDRDKPADSSARVLRGGSWVNYAISCRSACRGNGLPTDSNYDVGFRVARARKS